VLAAAIISLKAKMSAVISTALWGAIAGFFGLIAFGFFTGAVFVWISEKYDSFTACLIFGGVFALLAVIAIAVAMIRKRKANRLSRAQIMLLTAELANLGSSFGQAMKGPKGKYYLLAAIAAGWVLSKTMTRR
jgi:hypothetical protein